MTELNALSLEPNAYDQALRQLSADDQRHVAAFEDKLALLQDRVGTVATKHQNGTYITGRAGVGKTFTVLQTLEKLKVMNPTYRNGRMTGNGLFALLEEHPKEPIVIDDVPSLVQERPALQMLLAALGGKPGEARQVTYTTMETDGRRSFQFTGGLILISNRPLRRDPLADAVQSRVPIFEFDPSNEMIRAFIRLQAAIGSKGLKIEETQTVAEFVINETSVSEYLLDLRVYNKALGDYRFWKTGAAQCNWKDLVRSSIKVIWGSPNPLTRMDVKAHEYAIIEDLLKKYPGTDRTTKRIAEWTKRTGKSGDSYYRRVREMEIPKAA